MVNKDILAFLIENGADVNAQDKQGNTPLHNVYYREIKQIVFYHKDQRRGSIEGREYRIPAQGTSNAIRMLTEAGADITLKNKEGKSALDLSRELIGHIEDYASQYYALNTLESEEEVMYSPPVEEKKRPLWLEILTGACLLSFVVVVFLIIRKVFQWAKLLLKKKY